MQLKQYGEKQKKYYNLSAHGEEYNPGYLVYLKEKTRRKQVCPKLVPKWRRPYMVVKRIGTECDINSLESDKAVSL